METEKPLQVMQNVSEEENQMYQGDNADATFVESSAKEENKSDEVTTLEDATDKNQLKKKGKRKKIVVVCVILAVILAGAFYSYANKHGLFLTEEEKTDKIVSAYRWLGSNAAMELVENYYDSNSMKYALWRVVLTEAENETTKSDIKDEVEITDKSLTKDGNYCDFKASVKNNSDETLSYIKLNIYLYDNDMNMVDSHWTNWSGTLPPDGSAIIETTIRDNGTISKFKVEVDEVTVK